MQIKLKPVKKNYDVIFIENNYARLKFKKNISYKIVKKNTIYLNIFFKSILYFCLFNFKFSIRSIYIYKLSKFYNGKIVIGNHFNTKLSEIKEIDSSLITIIYFYYLMRKEQVLEYRSQFSKIKKIDYILFPNDYMKNSLSNLFIGKAKVIGFLKNNETIIKKKKKIFDLLIISEFREKMNDQRKKIIIKNLKLLSSFCKRNNLSVNIALASNRLDKLILFQKEKNFYNNIGFEVKKNKTSSYQLAAEARAIFSMNSNLGYELYSRGFKVFFIQSSNEVFLNKYKFKFKKFLGSEKYLKTLIKISSKKYKRYRNKNQKYFFYDKKNLLLKNIIYRHSAKEYILRK